MLYIQQDNGNAGKANEYAMDRMYAKAECTKKLMASLMNSHLPSRRQIKEA